MSIRGALALGATDLLALLSIGACGPPVSTASTGTSPYSPTTTTPVLSTSPLPSAPSTHLRGKAPITVTGSVSASLVSVEGPTTDGVFAGHSVAWLLGAMRRAGHGFLSCAPRDCWQARQLPASSIGVAFQANPLGCEQVQSVRVTSPRQGTIRFDVQAHPVCARGSGAAAKGTSILIAVPRSALPNTAAVTARVNLAMRPGDKFVPLGSASTSV